MTRVDELKQKYPQCKFCQYNPSQEEGHSLGLMRPVTEHPDMYYQLEKEGHIGMELAPHLK